jgi:hypothetical protein
MYIIIELWPEKEKAYILCNENGVNYMFENIEEAINFCNENAQQGVVICL